MLLARVYKTPGPWVYWGYRPAPRPANTVAWERTEAIAEALDRALDDPDDDVRLAVLRRMIREKVPTRARDPAALAGAPGPGRRTWPRSSSRCATTPPSERRDLLAKIVADRSHTPANRLAALALWPGGDEGTQPREAARAWSTRSRRPGARRGDPSPQQAVPARATPLLLRALGSPDPDVRAAAVEVAAALGRRRRGRASAGAARGSRSEACAGRPRRPRARWA